ncbi:flagellar type III secretion system pore protein FliP [Iodidimonas sp. MBR-22]|uniref:flagellar type III secretion system pore protein FliP n=1 Tax=unclassified Iodidimonas TaxID=2626145 RepID=UPI0032B1C69A
MARRPLFTPLRVATLFTAAFIWLVSNSPVLAQSLSVDLGQDGTLTGRVVQLLLLITVLSLAPSILIVMTSFTRIIIVLSLLRSALGTQQTPPNVVLISLAIFLTGFIMAPTLQAAWQQGIEPLINEEIEPAEALPAATAPFRTFMLANTREKDLQLFVDAASANQPETVDEIPLTSLIPAFVISELKRAFEIGFLIYIPFIVIDLVIASILMSMGMMMLPPVLISLPFKIIFFVLVDGWHLLAGSLMQSFTAS